MAEEGNEQEKPDQLAGDRRKTSIPNSEWLDRSHHIHLDETKEEIAYDEDDKEELIQDEDDVRRVLSLLEKQRRLHLNDKQNHALREARLNAQENAFSSWNDRGSFSDDEEERVKDFDQNRRLQVLWLSRHKAVNYFLAVAFHVVVIVNLSFCLWKSFGLLFEDSKFAELLLKDAYHCLNIVPKHDAVIHFVSIFHAVTCVTVLHAKTERTANLCWAFLCGTSFHACFQIYEVLFVERFKKDDSVRKVVFRYNQILLVLVLTFYLISVIIVLQRYYDLTARFRKRKHKFITQTYEGRQLNDRIMYRNVSSFVQRKYVLRTCTALQIHNTVQKIQVHKKKLKKGETVNEDIYNKDVRAACVALKEVEGFKGMDMMKELKRRHYENIKEEYEMGDPDAQFEEGNDERIEEIVEEMHTVV